MFCAYQDGKLIHFTLLDASGKPVGIQPVWARWNYEVANVLGECFFRSLCSTIPQLLRCTCNLECCLPHRRFLAILQLGSRTSSPPLNSSMLIG